MRGPSGNLCQLFTPDARANQQSAEHQLDQGAEWRHLTCMRHELTDPSCVVSPQRGSAGCCAKTQERVDTQRLGIGLEIDLWHIRQLNSALLQSRSRSCPGRPTGAITFICGTSPDLHPVIMRVRAPPPFLIAVSAETGWCRRTLPSIVSLGKVLGVTSLRASSSPKMRKESQA